MNKFWPFVLILIITASGLLYLENFSDLSGESGQINFKDIETECRRDGFSQVTLNDDDSLTFRGSFHVKNTDSDLGWDYSQTDGEISLNIKAEELSEPDSFQTSCRGSVYYHAQTERLEPGRYSVKLMHRGKVRKDVVLRVN